MSFYDKTMAYALTAEEASERIASVLKAAGIEAYITGHISATFPDGEKALYKALEVDTHK
ncbi:MULTISPECIES: hypothetical protein [unclassified Bradyrhizobium]|uniref:hypothetical protein n=1 Tax=unclassified Bradyrhizobium TaxID=2631580 RepID=UPI002915DF52|nr:MULTISPECIES: hypothetical protein [unclassified Bradyrhizobium]